LPEIPGPRTALLLLPFLAVGGAERLLFDLMAGWQGRYRLLVVTLEPHLAHLGHTVDRCRELTSHVYTLGDWLPREAHCGAVAHLLRRYQVETLVSWNGTVEFFDRVAAWRRAFPRLHICQQLYNHEGGWMERVTPRNLAAVDLHLAVNHHIARVLADRGVAQEKIEVVHHGVAVPTPHTVTHRNAERRRCRGLLGLPHDALVVGSFIRLHPQKRPLDIVHVARRLAARGIHFLLAGGGPLDAALDRELAREPLSNFTRLPLQADVETLYGAIDLCLSTSSYEGLPVFLLDGLARGLPCVTTAVGEIPALLAKGGGVLVEQPGDLQALCDGMLSFLDETHRHAEGERGRATVRENFSLETFRNHYEALFFPPLKETDG
jgi:glycosyltransferase involved in cell wall biosynthesis